MFCFFSKQIVHDNTHNRLYSHMHKVELYVHSKFRGATGQNRKTFFYKNITKSILLLIKEEFLVMINRKGIPK